MGPFFTALASCVIRMSMDMTLLYALVLVEALRDQQTLEENSYNTRGLVPARCGL